MTKTDILVSIGPASESPQVIAQLIDAGMTIARVNFSHASHDEAKRRFDRVRQAATERGVSVKLFQDLCGPRIRLGIVPGDRRHVAKGERITFYTDGAPAPLKDELPICDPYLHRDVFVGGYILFDSGKFKTQIVAVNESRQRITVEFLNGGDLLSKKGLNIPNVKLTSCSPTKKDKSDITFGIAQQVDCVAVSFAQSRHELEAVRALLLPRQELWAKVEDPIGVKNIDEIIASSDGIIVARGDLGVEVPQEDVPLIQKMIIKKCNSANKPVIVATQMLASMVNHPTPTRAEVSDIVNAVLDGATGIWVSEETTIGNYPIEVVKTMRTVADRIEDFIASHGDKDEPFLTPSNVLSPLT